MIILGIGAGIAAALALGTFLPESIFAQWREIAYAVVRYVISKLATLFFYAGYKELSSDLANKRREELFTKYGATPIECKNREGMALDVVYVPSSADIATGNLIVICLNTTYQDHHPRHWEPFLQSGADVVVWNPTKLGAVSYSEELSCLLRALRKRDPSQVIALKTYCASSDPAICAVAEQKDPNIHLIIDRGYGDAQILARSLTVMAGLSVVQDVIHDEWDCGGIWKIGDVYGKTAFLMAEHDQMMNCGGKNLTRELSVVRTDAVVIEFEGDHWSDWSHTEYNRVLRFLAERGVVSQKYPPITPEEFPAAAPLTWCKKESLPCMLKSWC